jgi:ankyrin repeat protein
MKRPGWNHLLIAFGLVAAPAAAQIGSDGVQFLEAVRNRDGGKATELLRDRPIVINARTDSGDTALLIAIGRRDSDWTGFLLQKGADPNLAARDGDTPLIAAARNGFGEAVDWLLSLGVKVDAANKMGETALIIAVQQRHTDLVKALLAAGADPDRTDSAAGYSARDYSARDTRARDIHALIEAAGKKKKPSAQDQDLNSFKL